MRNIINCVGRKDGTSFGNQVCDSFQKATKNSTIISFFNLSAVLIIYTINKLQLLNWSSND